MIQEPRLRVVIHDEENDQRGLRVELCNELELNRRSIQLETYQLLREVLFIDDIVKVIIRYIRAMNAKTWPYLFDKCLYNHTILTMLTDAHYGESGLWCMTANEKHNYMAIFREVQLSCSDSHITQTNIFIPQSTKLISYENLRDIPLFLSFVLLFSRLNIDITILHSHHHDVSSLIGLLLDRKKRKQEEMNDYYDKTKPGYIRGDDGTFFIDSQRSIRAVWMPDEECTKVPAHLGTCILQ